jgi:hypothetical protein
VSSFYTHPLFIARKMGRSLSENVKKIKRCRSDENRVMEAVDAYRMGINGYTEKKSLRPVVRF